MKYIVANWKSNKTVKEVVEWFKKIRIKFSEIDCAKLNNIEIVVCPPAVYLTMAKKYITNYSLPIKLGTQDVSSFEMGAYTGEISARMIIGLAEYTIIGHSERRKYFHEDDKLLGEKVKQARSFGLEAIFCIQDEKTYIPGGVKIAAYEPVWAIGSGKADTPDNANQVISIVKKQNTGVITVLYGGSVTPENIKSYLSCDQIDGVLIGGASLDAEKFWEIILHASTH